MLILCIIILSIIIIPPLYIKTIKYDRGYYYSNLLYFPVKKQTDIVILGSSRARIFEVCNNWKLTEEITNKKIVNLSTVGGSCIGQQIFLDYFYTKGNRTELVLYFIDPYIMVTDFFEKANFLDREPFDVNFFRQAMKGGLNISVLSSYVETKIQLPKEWLKIYDCEIYNTQIENIDSSGMMKRIEALTKSGETVEEMPFIQSQVIVKTIENIKRHGDKLIFIVPPTLIQNEPGYDFLIGFLKMLKKEKSIPYYNFHSIMQDKEYFYDYDHLNRDGVEYFLKHYLSPLLLKEKGTGVEVNKINYEKLPRH